MNFGLQSPGSYFKTFCSVFRALLNTCACQSCPMEVIISHQMPFHRDFSGGATFPGQPYPSSFHELAKGYHPVTGLWRQLTGVWLHLVCGLNQSIFETRSIWVPLFYQFWGLSTALQPEEPCLSQHLQILPHIFSSALRACYSCLPCTCHLCERPQVTTQEKDVLSAGEINTSCPSGVLVAKMLLCWMVPAFLLKVRTAWCHTWAHRHCEHMVYLQYTLLGTKLLISGSWEVFLKKSNGLQKGNVNLMVHESIFLENKH